MPFYRVTCTALLVTSLGACATLNGTKIESRPITDSYEVDGIRWDNGGSPLVFIFDTYNVEGKTALCGSYTFEKDTTFGSASFNDIAISKARIIRGSDTLSNDLTFFNQVLYPKDGKDLPDDNANCILTEVAWSEEQPEFEYTAGTITIID